MQWTRSVFWLNLIQGNAEPGFSFSKHCYLGFFCFVLVVVELVCKAASCEPSFWICFRTLCDSSNDCDAKQAQFVISKQQLACFYSDIMTSAVCLIHCLSIQFL